MSGGTGELELDGALVLRAEPGARVVLKKLKVACLPSTSLTFSLVALSLIQLFLFALSLFHPCFPPPVFCRGVHVLVPPPRALVKKKWDVGIRW